MVVVLSVAVVLAIIAVVLVLRLRGLSRRSRSLERELGELQRYEGIANAEAHANSLRSQAAEALNAAARSAEQMIATARLEGERVVRDADVHAASLRAQGADVLGAASRSAEQMTLAARSEGERIVRDAAAHAASLVSEATRTADRLTADAAHKAAATTEQAEAERSVASTTAANMLSEGRAEIERVKQASQAELDLAKKQASEIVVEANRRAQAIAGEALAAVQNARQAEQTVRALKNVIEGYGDTYIVPTQDLLDELGEGFGFTEAGARLKETRTKVRAAVRDGNAASCDYVEENRRTTAIDFVTDAFNGKVATLLAEIRDDNIGTLQQKIKDAYALVNHLGAAFRNARITPDYLDLRLEELKWAVAVQELKAREREEQRQLKERIREEERAQREFEKALKDAEKEEELLRKAMEKAQAQFDKASDAQKKQYEDQLAVLAEKLREAEERGQRALSMAQQTKSGHVYVISNVGSFGEHVYKIGLTRRLEPLERIRELGDASVPFEFDVHALIPSADAPALEHALHKRFLRAQVNKVNGRKEFFRVDLEEIRRELEKDGVQVAWTMTAACREYRESLAIERTLSAQQMAVSPTQQPDAHRPSNGTDTQVSPR